MENKKLPFINQLKNIITLFKEKEPTIEKPSNSESHFNSYIVKGIYSEPELSRFYKKDRELNYTQNQTNVLLQYLRLVSNNSKLSEEKLRNLVALNPEIKRAKKIFTASVMSPNDLQEELIEIIVDDPSMDTKLREEVEKYLNEFFNTKHEFGSKLTNWIGEYSYEVDAKPILILPKSNINDLMKYHKTIEEKGMGIFTEEEHITFHKHETISENKKTLVEKIYTEAWEVFEPIVDKDNKIVGKKIFKQAADSTIDFIQNHGSLVNFTTDIVKMTSIKRTKENKINTTSNDIIKRMYHSFQGDNTNIFVLDDKPNEENTQPIVMELPAKAVIPIIIPGSKEEHIGYFVLMDEWGNPISIFDNYNQYDNTDGGLSKKSSQAIFNTGNPLFANNIFGNDPNYKYEITQSIFNIAVKHIFEDKFKSNNLLDLPLNEFESLSKFLFHQMLNKNRTTVLFVPASLIVYYCDSYKEDGTGQSKISSIDFVLSLRTTLLVAGVMGGIRAAIDKEIIEVTIDQKNTNPEQTIELIRNTAIEKKALNFNATNPSMISRSITDAAISIVPKNFKGLDFELSKSKDSSASDFRPASDDLMETLTKMFIDSLDVPPSSLNQLDENEFAKSVTTNNIIFTNDIKKVQKQLRVKNKKYLSTYLKFSSYNQKELLDIYKKYKGNEDTFKEEGVIRLDDDAKQFLYSVISNIEANLPAPNISITKSNLEDLESELDFIDKVIEVIYSEDQIYTESSEYKDFLKSIAANVKSNLVKELLDKSSLHKNILFDDIKAFDINTIGNNLKALMNKHKGITNLEQAIKSSLEKEDVPEEDNSTSSEPSDDNSSEPSGFSDFKF